MVDSPSPNTADRVSAGDVVDWVRGRSTRTKLIGGLVGFVALVNFCAGQESPEPADTRAPFVNLDVTSTTIPDSVEVAPATPVPPTPVPPTAAPAPDCHSSYSPCVPNVSYDLNCPDIGFAVQVIGRDVFGFDRDNDGRGCESYG